MNGSTVAGAQHRKLPADTLIDAEVIEENGRCSFNALQHKPLTRSYPALRFDLVHRGRNAMRLPIEKWRKLLTEALLRSLSGDSIRAV